MGKNLIVTESEKKQILSLYEEKYDVKIRTFNPNTDFKTIYDNLSIVYSMVGMSNDEILNEIKPIDIDNSVIAEVNGDIAGFYFLRPKNIPEKVNPELYSELKNLTGLEGVALGVLPKYKNLGIGKKLIEYPKSLGYDYIWGYQYESLKNLKDWLKRRKYFGFDDDENAHVTYQIY
jgi:hypothetical protein